MHDATVKVRVPLRVVAAKPASDGAGVRLFRSVGTAALDMVDPFLLLDEFRSDDPGDYIAGFPDHPHRGFETVTIMLAGAMRHRDSVGNQGDLGPGSVQYMTAARGIVHSEMPRQQDGLMWGFQLWINLPSKDKMADPKYQDIAASEIPEVDAERGGHVRVIAGTFDDVTGPVAPGYTEPVLLDVRLEASGLVEIPLPLGHNAFVYIYDGKLSVVGGDAPVERGHVVVLGDGDRLGASSAEGARFLVAAGRPLDEPVMRYGPFVMTTKEEIAQAFADYRAGTLTS